MDEITCIICGHHTSFERSNYDKWTCPGCGQFYEYDETLMIVLTPEQLDILRKYAELDPR
jgi:ribosomal protein L37AE/L43A